MPLLHEQANVLRQVSQLGTKFHLIDSWHFINQSLIFLQLGTGSGKLHLEPSQAILIMIS